MKWFKHMSDAADDEKLAEVLALHGAAGYGVYWLIVEAIAKQMDGTDKCEVRYSSKKWAQVAHVDSRTLAKYLQTFSDLALIVMKKCGKFVTIKIHNLLKIRDEHSRKLRRGSRETPEQEVDLEVDSEKTPPLDQSNNQSVFSGKKKHMEILLRHMKEIEVQPSMLFAMEQWIRKGISLDKIEGALIETAGNPHRGYRWKDTVKIVEGRERSKSKTTGENNWEGVFDDEP